MTDEEKKAIRRAYGLELAARYRECADTYIALGERAKLVRERNRLAIKAALLIDLAVSLEVTQ